MFNVFNGRTMTALGGVLAVVAVSWSLSLPAVAQNEPAAVTASPEATTETEATETYWTSERLSEATPLDIPTPETPSVQGMPEGSEVVAPSLTESAGSVESGEGAPPMIDPGNSLARPISFTPDQPNGDDASTEATSSLGAHFTTTRVLPNGAQSSWPYRTAGKLFFRDPRRGTNHVCSAAVLRPRVVATAGHCVTNPSTNPSGRYFFTNFLFVPAFDNGTAPYGTWTSSQQWVSNDWHHSNGSVPNRGDMAILIMRDKTVSGSTRKIGHVTGWLGWRTNALQNNHVTMLGYPCNIDSCRKMQMTNAGSFASGGQNTFIYGSAGRGGHSGGPFIQDFGVAGSGSPPNLLGKNYLVGITSYGPVSTTPKYLGASNFGANFTNLLNAACNASPGNC